MSQPFQDSRPHPRIRMEDRLRWVPDKWIPDDPRRPVHYPDTPNGVVTVAEVKRAIRDMMEGVHPANRRQGRCR